MDIGDYAKYVVNGERVSFHFESGDSFDTQNVLYVPGLKKILLSVSIMEERGFVITFKKRKVTIHLEGYNPDTTMRIGARD